MKYHYLDADGQTLLGPYSARELKSVWMSLDLACSTLCVREGSEDWQPFKRMVNELYCGWSDSLSPSDRENDARLELLLKTKVQQDGERRYIAEQSTPIALRSFPCWELVRVGVKPPDQMRDWPSRWIKAGGTLYSGRMIAVKGSPIWEQLGSSELFEDALDTEFPPYALDSHMRRRAVPRETCEELGIPIPPGGGWTKTFGANPARASVAPPPPPNPLPSVGQTGGNGDKTSGTEPAPPSKPAKRSVSVRCSQITKKGEQCSRMTTSANGLCWQHVGN